MATRVGGVLFLALTVLSHMPSTSTDESVDLLYACAKRDVWRAESTVHLVVHSSCAGWHCQVTGEFNVTISQDLCYELLNVTQITGCQNSTSGQLSCGTSLMCSSMTITINNKTQPSFVVLSFQGRNGRVNVSCTQQIPDSTTPGTTLSSTDAEPSSSSFQSSPNTITSSSVSDDPNQTSINHSDSSASAAHNTTLWTTAESVKTTGNQDMGTRNQDMVSYVVLAVGVLFLVIAFIVLVYVVRTVRLRGKAEQKETKEKQDKARPKKRIKQRQGALGSSNASLISNQHNYEEVSEDGLSGSDVNPLQVRKTSSSVSPARGHQQEQRDRNQSGPRTFDVKDKGLAPANDPMVDDDYNVLDLCQSTRRNSAHEHSCSPQAPSTQQEESDYMEVGDGDGIYDNLREDVHQAKSQHGERTTPQIVSSQEDKDRPQVGCDAEVVFLNDTVAQKKTTNERATASQFSKSYEDVTAEPSSPKEMHMNQKYSRSLDLNKANYENHILKCSPGPLHGDTSTTRGSRHGDTSTTRGNCQHPTGTAVSNRHTLSPQNTLHELPKLSGHKRNSSSPMIIIEGKATDAGHDDVMLRKKSRRPNIKSAILTSVPHPKGATASFLEFQEAVRHSMEINPDELVMIDNVLYGTLPRNKSLPTTEL